MRVPRTSHINKFIDNIHSDHVAPKLSSYIFMPALSIRTINSNQYFPTISQSPIPKLHHPQNFSPEGTHSCSSLVVCIIYVSFSVSSGLSTCVVVRALRKSKQRTAFSPSPLLSLSRYTHTRAHSLRYNILSRKT